MMSVTFACDNDTSVDVPFDEACAYFGLVRNLARDTTDFAAEAGPTSSLTVKVPATDREMNAVLDCCRSATVTQSRLTTFLQCSELDWPNFAAAVAKLDHAWLTPGHAWLTPAVRRKLWRAAVRSRMDLAFIKELWVDSDGIYIAKYGAREVMQYYLDGHPECVRWKHSKAAAEHGNLDCIKLLYADGHIDMIEDAVESGNIDAVKYITDRDTPLSRGHCLLAARKDDLPMLKYICGEVGCSTRTVMAAFYAGAQKCMHHALQECPESNVTFSGNFEHCVGSAENLAMLEAHGIKLPSIKCACRGGHIDGIEFLRTRGKKWTADDIARVSFEGYPECLKYMHEHGCPWDHRTTDGASETGRLRCLKYAAENGCPCKVSACIKAVEFGRTKCLRYLLETGRACDHTVVELAVKRNRVKCLALLRAHGYA